MAYETIKGVVLNGEQHNFTDPTIMDKILNAFQLVSFPETGGVGKYIKSIKQENGKITAVADDLPSFVRIPEIHTSQEAPQDCYINLADLGIEITSGVITKGYIGLLVITSKTFYQDNTVSGGDNYDEGDYGVPNYIGILNLTEYDETFVNLDLHKSKIRDLNIDTFEDFYKANAVLHFSIRPSDLHASDLACCFIPLVPLTYNPQ